MRRLLLLILLFINVSASYGQTVKLDSLMNKLLLSKEKEKSSIYTDITQQFFNINIDSALLYSNKAKSYSIKYKDEASLARTLALQAYIFHLQAKNADVESQLKEARDLAVESNSEQAIMESYNISGAYYLAISKYDLALELFTTNYHYCLKVGNLKYELRSLNNIGAIYYRQEKIPEAIKYFTRALLAIKKTDDRRGEVNLLLNLGNIYSKIGENEKARKAYYEVIEMAEQHHIYEVSFLAYHNMGNIYKGEKKYKLAKACFEKTLEYSKKLSDKSKLPFIYGQLGHIYMKTNKKDSAYIYIRKSIDLAQKYKDIRLEALNKSFYAELLLSDKKYKEAETLIKSNISISKENRLLDLEGDSYWRLASLYYRLEKYKLAFDFNEKYHSIYSEIYSKEKSAKVEELKLKYEIEKRDLENSLLKTQAEISQMALKNNRYALIGFAVLIFLLVLFVIYIFYNYSKRGRLNKELNRVNAELENANNTKDRFFSIISHDLRSPFNSMQGFSQLIGDNDKIKDDEELREYSNVLIRTSESTLDLLDSVLTWAKMQAGGMEVNVSPINVYRLISEVRQTYESQFIDKDISFINNCTSKSLISADEDICKTILRNLYSNAIKFTKLHGEIKVSCEEKEGRVILSIKDNGVGIPKKEQYKIFAIDEKITKLGTKNEKGSGFGLILVKDLAILNGGDVWFESEEGVGTTFYISFNMANV
jgi:signal transduction histidine kinase